MKTGKREISVGDWVLLERGHSRRVSVAQVTTVYDDGSVEANGLYWHPSRVKRLPASPSDLAKSHALLMRWAASRYSRTVSAPMLQALEKRIFAHHARLTTKQSRRGGKGRRHA